MGALDPIASNIGHGQLGLRSGLRLFSSPTGLTGESSSQKHGFVESRAQTVLGVGAPNWSVDAGSVYKVTVDEIWRGRRLDVVSVRRSTEVLTRVDQRSDVVAGTYYFNPTATAASNLYVQLSDSSNPASDNVAIVFGFYFGNCAVIHPTLGPDKLVDGSLETWTSSTSLTNWVTTSLVGATSAELKKESAIIADGSFSAKLDGTLVSGGRIRIRPSANVTTVAGLMYRFSGYYRTSAVNQGGIVPGIDMFDVTNNLFILDDGRTTASGTALYNQLDQAPGDWRRFAYDFIATSTATRPGIGLFNGGASGYGEMWVDGLQLQRIYRFEYFEPRLTMDSLPDISEGRSTIFFDRWFTGTGTLKIANGEAGAMESLYGKYEVANNDCTVYVGGRLPQGGNEILLDGMMLRRFISRQARIGDATTTIALDSPVTIWKEMLPRRTFTLDVFGDLESRDVGRPRTIVLGGSFGLRPARVTEDGTNHYGAYEGIDPLYVTNVLPTASSSFYSYSSEQAANKLDAAEYALGASTLAATNASALAITSDCGAVRIKAGVNDTLDFDRGAGALVATIAPGLYMVNDSGASLATAIHTALDAAAAGSTVTYDDATHKYTISYGAGTLNFQLTSAAPNAAKSAWATIGYTSKTDKNGFLSYAADTAMFTGADTSHIIRVNVNGYKDDTSGTYTGTASAVISRSMDCVHFLLRKVFGLSASLVDTGALANVRASDQNVRLTIGKRHEADTEPSTVEFGDIIQRLESSSGIDVVFTGSKFTFVVRDNSVPANILDLYDRDFVGEFEGYYDQADLASTIKLIYEDQTYTGVPLAIQYDSSLGLVRLNGLPALKTFRVQNDSSSVAARRDSFATNCQNVRRRFKFTVKGACMGKLPMDKLRINRSQFLGKGSTIGGGNANYVVVRILNATHNLATFESAIEAAEVLTGISGAW